MRQKETRENQLLRGEKIQSSVTESQTMVVPVPIFSVFEMYSRVEENTYARNVDLMAAL